MASYAEIIAGLSPAMKAGQADRVALLKRVLAALNHPDLAYRIVHLAGTNGKGSTGQLLTQLLRASGARVGHFASPALVDDREQIQLDDRPISKAAFVATYDYIRRRLPAGIAPADLTVFEWWTLVALQYFATAGAQWVVLEVGLGGEKDATNAIAAPTLAVITHLALDHCKILGNRLEEIAAAKAGIIKPGSRAVVVAPEQDPRVLTVLKAAANRAGVPLVMAAERATVAAAGEGQVTITRPGHRPLTTALGLKGSYQLANLTTALAALDQLKVALADSQLAGALATVRLPGRFQLLGEQPPVIIDGAHNPDGARHLLAALKAAYPQAKFFFVLGFLADKNVAAMVDLYRPVASRSWLVTPDHPTRRLPAQKLRDLLLEGEVAPSVAAGLKAARAAADPQTVVVVTGSFYVIREVAKKWSNS